MLKDKIDEVMDTMEIAWMSPGMMPTTQSFNTTLKGYKATDRDIKVGLERKFGWVVPISTIRALRG